MPRRSSVTSMVATSRPSISTWPLVGSTRRLTILSEVVLPQPLGPTSTQISPGRHHQRQIHHRPVRAVLLADVAELDGGLVHVRRSPVRTGSASRLSGGASGQTQLGS